MFACFPIPRIGIVILSKLGPDIPESRDRNAGSGAIISRMPGLDMETFNGVGANPGLMLRQVDICFAASSGYIVSQTKTRPLRSVDLMPSNDKLGPVEI
ncbi:hypothetical protein BDFG_02110 [Blastomyces dermatitidis ATCC 26199]|nr:hypothetical protein BDFG_02110 [Blastomyces dermatitidis ATCC 26199]